jgi:hypothetical protein
MLRLHLPTLAISCADDLYGTYDGARYTADHIPGARFVGDPSGGHLWVGHQHDVTKDITQFLKETARPYAVPALALTASSKGSSLP